MKKKNTLSEQETRSSNTPTYLGLKISSTGNFYLAVNELKAKAHRVFDMINNTIQHEIPI